MLTSKQRAFLRGMANGMDAIFQVGKNGVTPELRDTVYNALEARELVKISVLDNNMLGAREAAEMLASRTGAEVVLVSGGMVQDFLMNDKCSAGTGKFLEIMANRLGVTLQELFDMADTGDVLSISSLCTVFAESEVINYIGEGKKREDIAAGVVDSVAAKVSQLAGRKNLADKVILTGGLSNSEYFTRILSEKLGKKVEMTENGRYAGAIGAALLAEEKSKRRR